MTVRAFRGMVHSTPLFDLACGNVAPLRRRANLEDSESIRTDTKSSFNAMELGPWTGCGRYAQNREAGSLRANVRGSYISAEVVQRCRNLRTVRSRRAVTERMMKRMVRGQQRQSGKDKVFFAGVSECEVSFLSSPETSRAVFSTTSRQRPSSLPRHVQASEALPLTIARSPTCSFRLL